LDGLELFDVDEDDADLALFDEDLFHAIEDERKRRQGGGAIEEHGLEGSAAGLRRFAARIARATEHGLHALDHFVAVEGLDEIVVRADLEAGQAILHVAAAGDEN